MPRGSPGSGGFCETWPGWVYWPTVAGSLFLQVEPRPAAARKGLRGMTVRLTILGSGTSHGVPMVGCDCPTCRSTDPRDNRTNASVLLSVGESAVLIDCGRDFRTQALRAGLRRLDALIVTHSHYDHIAGIDDLRVFTTRGRGSLPVYGPRQHLDYIREHSFRYLFQGNGHEGGGVAKIDLMPVNRPFEVCGVEFLPIPVLHGNTDVFGYRFLDCAYIPDVSRVSDEARASLRGLRLLIIDGLRYRPHVSHFSIDQAVAVAKDLAPQRTLVTHLCHDVVHADLEARLASLAGGVPNAAATGRQAAATPWVAPAYDGLEIPLSG
jgi:phosphoribosyl 1,2-cyclic phosphate phosphodiesterase